MRVFCSMLLLAISQTISVCSNAGAQDPFPPASSGARSIGLLDAIRSTLELHPLLHYQQQQVEITRAIKQQAGGDFDARLKWSAGQSRLNDPVAASEKPLDQQSGVYAANLETNLTSLSGSTQRLLRSGILVGSSLKMDRTTDNAQNLQGVSRTRLSFDITLPLWRDKGREVVTARETSAQLDVEASLYDLNQTIAELILSTVTSYWHYVATLKQQEILRGSEERAREFVDGVAALIKADRLPRNEIEQVQANFASRTAGRISVEQQLIEARNNLGLAMGLPPTRLMDLSPSDPFPDERGKVPPSVSAEDLKAQIEHALMRRADFLASEKKIKSAEVLRKSAANNLHPKLDLIFSGGYSSLRDGRGPDDLLVSVFTHAHGPDIAFSLNYSFPLGNSSALGRIAEAGAAYQQAVLASTEKARVIANGVVNALMAVSNGLNRLRKAREAVAGYQLALEGEKDKLRLGVGSLTDLLTIDGRLTDVMRELVDAQRFYAIALAQYRFASGTLIVPDRTMQSIERDIFLDPPE